MDHQLFIKDLHSQFLMVNNGKYAGGGMVLNPYGLVNDGYCELSFISEIISKFQLIKFIGGAKEGIHAYAPWYKQYRA